MIALSSRQHPHLYEINTWVWLNELTRKAKGTIRLGDVQDQEWDAIHQKGFDGIWLMGIWERSPQSRQIARSHPDLRKEYDEALPDWQESDVVGSPYSIRAYRPDPELASWGELTKLLEKLHDRGMKLILDFVSNHTALDHEWIIQHPEYYIQGTSKDVMDSPSGFFPVETSEGIRYLAHGKDPNFPAWTDTAQLNYFNPDTREALLRELHNISKYCDGVRCDMAMLVLNEVFAQTWGKHVQGMAFPSQEFWEEAIAHLPDFMWIAEVYWGREWVFQQLGFQFTYDKGLYDRLRQASPQEVMLHLQANAAFQNKLVRFLENHDEARSAVVFESGRLSAVGVLVATLPGMRLYHQGQLTGKRIRTPVQLCRAHEESPDDTVAAYYDRILAITNEEVFHVGEWLLLTMDSAGDDSFNNLIAYQWKSNQDWKLIVVNISAFLSQGAIQVQKEPEMGLHRLSFCALYDQFTDQVYEVSREELMQQGLNVRLDPFGFHIFSLITGSGQRRTMKS